jgi:hypothetical protein
MKLYDDKDLIVSGWFDNVANTRGYGVLLMVDKDDLSNIYSDIRATDRNDYYVYWIADFDFSISGGYIISSV